MQIQIPTDAEPLIRSQAQAAGFDEASDYVINLVREDEQRRQWEASIAGENSIEQLALQGVESGNPLPPRRGCDA